MATQGYQPFNSKWVTKTQCMKWPVANSLNSTWFWIELPENCCEPLKFIMKYISIQFCERPGHGRPFHALKTYTQRLPFSGLKGEVVSNEGIKMTTHEVVLSSSTGGSYEVQPVSKDHPSEWSYMKGGFSWRDYNRNTLHDFQPCNRKGVTSLPRPPLTVVLNVRWSLMRSKK